MSVAITNQVINSNLLVGPLMFGLDAGAPEGARVNTTNGIFRWAPSRAQARSTNAIRVWMADSGVPPVTATNAFTIVVDDYLELFLGQDVLQVGQSGSATSETAAATVRVKLESDCILILPIGVRARTRSPFESGEAPSRGETSRKRSTNGSYSGNAISTTGLASRGRLERESPVAVQARVPSRAMGLEPRK
jgi:hypothetical protein